MFCIDQLRNGKYVIITSYGDIAFTRSFETEHLAKHFLEFFSHHLESFPEDTIEMAYEEWKVLFFNSEEAIEENLKFDYVVIDLLDKYFKTLNDEDVVHVEQTERTLHKYGACGFVNFLVENGYLIKKA